MASRFSFLCSCAAVACASDDFVPLPWHEARASAEAILANMTPEEKVSLMNGIGFDGFKQKEWWYVGNTAPIPRLGIPSLNLQDNGQGFRVQRPEMLGTVTCWPSMLALAATWNEPLVREFGRALADEFAGKGANGVLGPAVNVHHLASGGRNWEYLSGEDPYLGSRLARQYVEGVHSRRGVFTVAKHFAMNEQETNRLTESSVVDAKTRWELYYPPFEAAVDAGAAAVMCSYNEVDGVHACSNPQLLRDDLKGSMGFQGFVMSDWWATTSTAVAAGQDQDMPGTIGQWYSPENLLCKADSMVFGYSVQLLALLVPIFAAAAACSCLLLRRLYAAQRRELRESLLDREAPRSPTAAQAEEAAADESRHVEQRVCPPHRARPSAVCVMTLAWCGAAVAFAALAVGWLLGAIEFHACDVPDPEAIDESVLRILSAMYRHDLFNTTRCSAPCKELLLANVTSEAHSRLARDIAARSIVLLKNEGGVLPLDYPDLRTIAVIGSAAFSQVSPGPDVVAIEQWVALHLVLAACCLACFCCTWVRSRIPALKYPALLLALAMLAAGVMLVPRLPELLMGAFSQGDYYSGGGSGRVQPLWASRPIDGIRSRAEAANVTVLEADTDDFALAEDAVRKADITIIVGAATSAEGHDRGSLALDGSVGDLIEAAAKVAKRTVVIAQAPGAIVMPWSSSVDSIALMFLGGEQTGAAWADVLFGDQAPTGKLPITLPLTEEDQIHPGEGYEVHYSEGLKTGYRAAQLKYSFPFGHGLTYTTFSYGLPSFFKCRWSQACPLACGQAPYCVSLDVVNTGQRGGATVAQLYLEYPLSAGEPAPILKGFFATGDLHPGGSAIAMFPLSLRDISFYEAGAWLAAAHGVVHIGDSFADIRRTVNVTFD